jgi:hypothetical protein
MVPPLIINMNDKLAKLISEYVFVRENNMIFKLGENEEEEINRMFLQNPDAFIKHKENIIKKKISLYRKQRAAAIKKSKKNPSEPMCPLNYYKRIRIGDLKFWVTYKSNNMFMNFENLKMFTNDGKFKDKLYSTKDIYEKMGSVIKKTVLTSIFMHKVLRIRRNIEDDESNNEKEYNQKRKMLLGW